MQLGIQNEIRTLIDCGGVQLDLQQPGALRAASGSDWRFLRDWLRSPWFRRIQVEVAECSADYAVAFVDVHEERQPNRGERVLVVVGEGWRSLGGECDFERLDIFALLEPVRPVLVGHFYALVW